MKTILVTGSRDWTDETIIRNALQEHSSPGDTLIHGVAMGADSICASLAEEFGLNVIGMPADWKNYGKRAGIIRNLQMLARDPDIVLAFPLRQSKGTTHMISVARQRGYKVYIYEFNED